MKQFRMIEWMIITAALLAIIAVVAPHLLAIDLHKISLLTLGGVVGYWIDRGLFPYARPDKLSGVAIMYSAAMLRRSVIVGAAILGVSLGA